MSCVDNEKKFGSGGVIVIEWIAHLTRFVFSSSVLVARHPIFPSISLWSINTRFGCVPVPLLAIPVTASGNTLRGAMLLLQYWLAAILFQWRSVRFNRYLNLILMISTTLANAFHCQIFNIYMFVLICSDNLFIFNFET